MIISYYFTGAGSEGTSIFSPETLATAFARVLAAGAKKDFPFDALVAFLDSHPGKFASLAERALERCADNSTRFALLQYLTNVDPFSHFISDDYTGISRNVPWDYMVALDIH